MGFAATLPELSEWTLTSVQSALTHLQRPLPLKFVCPNATMSLSSVDCMLMARFLKQSFA